MRYERFEPTANLRVHDSQLIEPLASCPRCRRPVRNHSPGLVATSRNTDEPQRDIVGVLFYPEVAVSSSLRKFIEHRHPDLLRFSPIESPDGCQTGYFQIHVHGRLNVGDKSVSSSGRCLECGQATVSYVGNYLFVREPNAQPPLWATLCEAPGIHLIAETLARALRAAGFDFDTMPVLYDNEDVPAADGDYLSWSDLDDD